VGNYIQRDGSDKYHNKDDDGNTENRGKVMYDEDGLVKRWDNISPSANDRDKHHHEWINKKSDGSYKYGHGEHDNH
jgi:hypothetical protein